ncbi:hypothetical protein QR680_003685 [Steinernema hermaphroditum]|uniref:Uncharacterized protein n=1 Tax=Steinernema hermaphroditum TaxID=289476 RepID=A0AA39HM71_9BILA|nr:hypothetical protein QR680_003685 [Steinernema hermaphroditum]
MIWMSSFIIYGSMTLVASDFGSAVLKVAFLVNSVTPTAEELISTILAFNRLVSIVDGISSLNKSSAYIVALTAGAYGLTLGFITLQAVAMRNCVLQFNTAYFWTVTDIRFYSYFGCLTISAVCYAVIAAYIYAKAMTNIRRHEIGIFIQVCEPLVWAGFHQVFSDFIFGMYGTLGPYANSVSSALWASKPLLHFIVTVSCNSSASVPVFTMARLSVIILLFALIALSCAGGIPARSLSRSSAPGGRPYFAVPTGNSNNQGAVKRQCAYIFNDDTGYPECIFG